MPGAEVVAVPALPTGTGRGAEVVEIGSGIGRGVVVIASRWARPCEMATPGRVVAVAELLGRARAVGVVAERDDGAGDAIEKGRGRLIGVGRAIADVARADQDRVVRGTG